MAEIFGYPIMGGGSDLNFKVIAVASESALPSTAAENTIAVITTSPITSYVFSSTAPTSPTEGMVWFTTGAASAVGFNAIKKNGLWVYPTGCQQYVSGAWVSKTAKTYRDGAWALWKLYLYNAGDECTDITGGWTADGYNIPSGHGGSRNPLIKEANRFVSNGAPSTMSMLGTALPIDTTGFSRLNVAANVTGTVNAGTTNATFFLLGVYSKSSFPAGDVSINNNGLGIQTMSIDISAVNTSLYVFVMFGYSELYTGYVTQVWLD